MKITDSQKILEPSNQEEKKKKLNCFKWLMSKILLADRKFVVKKVSFLQFFFWKICYCYEDSTDLLMLDS